MRLPYWTWIRTQNTIFAENSTCCGYITTDLGYLLQYGPLPVLFMTTDEKTVILNKGHWCESNRQSRYRNSFFRQTDIEKADEWDSTHKLYKKLYAGLEAIEHQFTYETDLTWLLSLIRGADKVDELLVAPTRQRRNALKAAKEEKARTKLNSW